MVAELVDAQDLKSCGEQSPCGFKSRPRHVAGSEPKAHAPLAQRPALGTRHHILERFFSQLPWPDANNMR